MNPLTTTMLGYYRPEYDSFTLSTLMNSYTTALYCCGNSILRDTLRVLHRLRGMEVFFIFNVQLLTLCLSFCFIYPYFLIPILTIFFFLLPNTNAYYLY